MNTPPVECQNLQEQVNVLLHLLEQEPSLRTSQDITAVQRSLHKAIAATFDIVFAGAFSAGKSMLINALLERDLLYSAEGHATGTECYIKYAPPEREQVVLTYLSEAEVREQADVLCQRLAVPTLAALDSPEEQKKLHQFCEQTIAQEGGESKSERAKQANALKLLLEGFAANREQIQPQSNATYSMEQFNFANLQEAASYARRGSNSAVLKRIEYYCHHPLLEDGNIIIDTPGIDAPVERDRQRTYQKIEDPETSAVVCVLKAASAGDMTTEETELLEKIRANPGIRDRVFFDFNRVDATWYNVQLRQRLEQLIATQFRGNTKVYETSGLLGFWGSQVKQMGTETAYGLDGSVGDRIREMFVPEFNRYCAGSGKLPPQKFRISVNSYETPEENYRRILAEWGLPLLEHLIADSGIERFRDAITRYLTEEKRPQLFESLAQDLQPVCKDLREFYLKQYRELDSQPKEIEGIKTRRLEQLNQDLQTISAQLKQHIQHEVNEAVTNHCLSYEEDFRKLKVKMVARLDELLNTFSVEAAYSRATSSHPRNATAPLLAILVEALYYIANELEDVLQAESERVMTNLFDYIIEQVRHQEYYRNLCRLVGTDAGVEQALREVEKNVQLAVRSAASIECDRYVRESPVFYAEGTFSIFQFRQVLQQTSQGYDCTSMVEAEPAIRQLLKLDFEPKVKKTIHSTFRQTLNQVMKTHLLQLVNGLEQSILQQYNRARSHLEATLEKEAQEQLFLTQQLQEQLSQNMAKYNQAVMGINRCLQAFHRDMYQLPLVDMVTEVLVQEEAIDGMVEVLHEVV